LKNAIETLFADLPRKGRTPTFTTEQQAAILAIACENASQESERPIFQFTAYRIAAEADKREIVPTISPTTVWSFFKIEPMFSRNELSPGCSPKSIIPQLGTLRFSRSAKLIAIPSTGIALREFTPSRSMSKLASKHGSETPLISFRKAVCWS
jgi:hypothetical protein